MKCIHMHTVLLCLSFFPPANEVCEGYVFTGVCLSTGGGYVAGGMCMVGGVHGQ